MLLSRTQSKLEAAAAELGQKFGVQTKVIAVDFGKANADTWSKLKGELSSVDAGILINNVGLSYDHAEYLDQLDETQIDELIAINILATTKVFSPHSPCNPLEVSISLVDRTVGV